MPSLYEMAYEQDVEEVLAQLLTKTAKEFRTTLIGNRLTVRWNFKGQLVEVRMILDHVTTVKEAAGKCLRGGPPRT